MLAQAPRSMPRTKRRRSSLRSTNAMQFEINQAITGSLSRQVLVHRRVEPEIVSKLEAVQSGDPILHTAARLSGAQLTVTLKPSTGRSHFC